MKALNVIALLSVFVSSATQAAPVSKWKLDAPPLPGVSGHHTANGVTTIYYGDDDLPGHMRHVQRNQALHPENRQPMVLAHSNDVNHNPNHATTTTVEHRGKKESSEYPLFFSR